MGRHREPDNPERRAAKTRMEIRKERMKMEREAKLRESKGNIFIKNVPLNTRQMFKVYCTKKGLSMSWVLRKFMTDCINGVYDD